MHYSHVSDFYGVERNAINKIIVKAHAERNKALRDLLARVFTWGGRNKASEMASAPSQAAPVGSV